MRTVRVGDIDLVWDEEFVPDFRAKWRDVTLCVSRDGDEGWGWAILYGDLGEAVEADGFDRAQTAADDLAEFLRKVGALPRVSPKVLPRHDCLVRYEGDALFRMVDFTAGEGSPEWHFADDSSPVDTNRVAEWKPTEEDD